MKPMADQPASKRVGTDEDKITNDEKVNQVNEPNTDLQPASQTTRFRQNFENGMTVEEAKKDTIDHIKQLYARDSQIEAPSINQKTKFRQDFEKAIPIEESKRRMIEHICKYYENKH